MRGSYKVPTSTCPHCHKEWDAGGDAFGAGAPPGKGDLTVCIACGGLAQYGRGMKLHVYDEDRLLPEERADVMKVRAALAAVQDSPS